MGFKMGAGRRLLPPGVAGMMPGKPPAWGWLWIYRADHHVLSRLVPTKDRHDVFQFDNEQPITTLKINRNRPLGIE